MTLIVIKRTALKSVTISTVSFFQIPDHFKTDVQVDCMIKTARPNGACLFNCASDWAFGTDEKMPELRMTCHKFIVDNFEFYKHFITLPFQETVGVGENSRSIMIETYDELISFLLSEESLMCFSTSSMDISCIATLLNINIYTFVYSTNNACVPHWICISPNKELSRKSPYLANGFTFMEMWLYNNKDCHYDLLVPRHLCPSNELSINQDSEKSDHIKTIFSPMVFAMAKKGPGRPKNRDLVFHPN